MNDQMCSFEGCGRERRAHNLCQGHNAQRLRGQELKPIKRKNVRNTVTGLCNFDGCGRLASTKGLCKSHYAQRVRGKELTPLRPLNGTAPKSACSFDLCDRLVYAKSLCDSHYSQQAAGRVLKYIRTLRDVSDEFLGRVHALGGVAVGEYVSARGRVKCKCVNGHDCYPTPRALQSGKGLCRTCAGKVWNAFYVVTDGTTVKFGITSGDPAPRLADHHRDGLTGVLRLTTGMPPNAAPWLEAQCLTVLRESGAEPVRGREYFAAAQWGDLILGIVDRFS